MSSIASVLCTLAGAALVVLVLRDAFEALFHPDGRTVLSRAIMRGSWRLFHRLCARRPRHAAAGRSLHPGDDRGQLGGAPGVRGR